MVIGRAPSQGKVTSAVMWANSADTFVDVYAPDNAKGRTCHFMSECNQLEFFLFSSKDPQAVSRKQKSLFGVSPQPPLWSLGYHQCRWNYMSQDELLDVSSKMVEHSIPCDTVWLDIEHTNEKEYFTWNRTTFPDPASMLQKINQNRQRLVTIVDPHIRVSDDYVIYAKALESDLFIKDDDGKPFEGRCWPKQSSWLDFMNPKTTEFLEKVYTGQVITGDAASFIWSDPSVHIWNDMN